MGNSGKPVSICITSGKGGVGKTSVAANLAFALSESGRRVLLVDGDLGLANVDVLLGLPVQRTIRDVLDGSGHLLESVVYLQPNLGILPASSGASEMVSLEMHRQALLGDVLNTIGSHFDYILIDTAAGIGPSVLWFNTFATHILVVLTPDPTSMTDAYALIKVLATKYNKTRFHLVLNMVDTEQEAVQISETLARVAEQFLNVDIQHLGTVPQDKCVLKAVRDQAPFLLETREAEASQAILILADRVLKL